MLVYYVLFAFVVLSVTIDFLFDVVLLKVVLFCRRNRMQYDRDGLTLSMKMNMRPDSRV